MGATQNKIYFVLSAACHTHTFCFHPCYYNCQIIFLCIIARENLPFKTNKTVFGQQQLWVNCLPKISAIHSRYWHCSASSRIMVSVKSFSSLTLKAHFVNNSLLSEILLLLLIVSEQCATLDNQRSATLKVYLRSLSIRYFINGNNPSWLYKYSTMLKLPHFLYQIITETWDLNLWQNAFFHYRQKKVCSINKEPTQKNTFLNHVK